MDLDEARRELWNLFEQQPEVTRKLRALWCLHVSGGVPQERLIELLAHPDEQLRVWAVQLLVDDGRLDSRVLEAFPKRAESESSGLVLTYLASALQRMPGERRFALAESIAAHGEFAQDRVLPLMVWYGVESAVLEYPAESLRLIEQSRMPRLSRCLARRLTGEIDAQPAGVAGLMQILNASPDGELRKEILRGMASALRGWSRAAAPPGWAEFANDRKRSAEDAELSSLVRELSIVFGEGLDAREVIQFVLDPAQPAESRRQAIRSLAATRTPGLSDALERLLDDPAVGDAAVRGLAAIDLPRFASRLAAAYERMDGPGKDAAVEVLATRADTASLLLDAVQHDRIPRNEVDAYLLRQMQLLGDDTIRRRLAEIWPNQRLIAEDKLRKIGRYRESLNPAVLASADLSQGRTLYNRTCGQCHKLFGEGGSIGPELTGAQRGSLAYWLENLLDPSAAIPDEYRMSLVLLDDGRLLSGLIGERSRRTLTLQTPNERLVLPRSSIESIESSPLSMMPDGQLDAMSESQVRDLIAYLMSPEQVDSKGESGSAVDESTGRERPGKGD